MADERVSQIWPNTSVADAWGLVVYGFFLRVLSLESLDSSCSVDEFLLSGEEGVALRADLQVDLRLGRSRLE